MYRLVCATPTADPYSCYDETLVTADPADKRGADPKLSTALKDVVLSCERPPSDSVTTFRTTFK
jgi:hypothetical protein